MPEFVEAEAFRRTAEPLLEARITRVTVLDGRLLRRTDADRFVPTLVGARIVGLRRIGKLVLGDLDGGSTLALGFGLRGRLIVDGTVATTADRPRRPAAARPEHVRLRVEADGHLLELEDQLRLATAEIDIDESRLGIDVLALTQTDLRARLDGSTAMLKSRLMDQRVIAGIGNLLADEILFQAGLDPRRPCGDLAVDDARALWQAIDRVRRHALCRGGSHHGELIQTGSRRVGAACPRCDVDIERVRVGGRTSFFCPAHQSSA